MQRKRIEFNDAGNCYMWEEGATHKGLIAFKFSIFTDSSAFECLRFIFKRFKLLREIQQVTLVGSFEKQKNKSRLVLANISSSNLWLQNSKIAACENKQNFIFVHFMNLTRFTCFVFFLNYYYLCLSWFLESVLIPKGWRDSSSLPCHLICCSGNL